MPVFNLFISNPPLALNTGGLRLGCRILEARLCRTHESPTEHRKREIPIGLNFLLLKTLESWVKERQRQDEGDANSDNDRREKTVDRPRLVMQTHLNFLLVLF
jgi:hypothetical protein